MHTPFRLSVTVAFVLFLTATGRTNAQTALPGDSNLPSSPAALAQLAAADQGNYTYQAEDYFAKPKLSRFQLSPKGTYLSYREKDEQGKQHVYVKQLATGKITRVLTEGEELIRNYAWENDNRLLYVQDQGGDENYQLYAVDANGANTKALTPFPKVRVEILNMLRDDPNHIIISMNKENAQVFEPYKLNIVTGALEKLFENKDLSSPIMGYDFDKDGFLRTYQKQVKGTETALMYRPKGAKDFTQIAQWGWQDHFNIQGFDYSNPQSELAYVSSNIDRDKIALLLYDFKANKPVKVLQEQADFDMDGLSRSRKRNYEVDYYYYSGEKSQIIPVSATFKKIYARLTGELGNMNINIVDATDAEDKLVVFANSDRVYGRYYLYDTKKETLSLLADLMPNLKATDMAEVRPVSFTARDGYKLYGYLTLPKAAAEGKKVPMVINPHGGPYGVRDEWGFNPETQLFASRGYATLQINYRGSGGYGKKFFLAGSKQIGRNMLNDLEDGVHYAIGKGWTSPGKIAVYGGSYGGLATLGSLVKTPDLYRCGVDYVGVSNLFTFINSFPPYWKPFMKQFYAQWYDAENAAEKDIMTAVSPALNIDKINKPLFVIQGANDPRVNINESDQIVKSLRSKGFDVPYMVKYNEGHGFHHEENRIALYKTMLGFFAKHLK